MKEKKLLKKVLIFIIILVCIAVIGIARVFGVNAYESLYRARDIFVADKIIIVTQKYHLYRALYIAKQLGIEAYGVTSDYGNTYGGSRFVKIVKFLCGARSLLKQYSNRSLLIWER